MASIYEINRREVTDTPVILFDCKLTNGAIERWSTHAITIGGNAYAARVLKHNLFDLRAASDQGTDGLSKVSLTLANADSHFSQVERSIGFKGSKLSARFIFIDLLSGSVSSDQAVVFQGMGNPAEEIIEATFRITFTNRLSLQRGLLPEVRIQRRCPWTFPATAADRADGVHGSDARGKYAPVFRCGYSPGLDGGAGNMNAGAPFTTCDYSRSQCEERGMFSKDQSGQVTRRFGGLEFVPSSILVKSYGEKGQHLSSPVENEARYNDFVPLVYGTAWYRPPVVFARNDGNLTHLEVLLGMGEIGGVLKVIANNIEIPQGVSGRNMTGTGWFNIVSLGNRTGDFNQDFRNSADLPAGDPYGSMAVLSVVAPNRISDGTTLPRIEVLLKGIKLPVYGADGVYTQEVFTNNPAWVLLDVLRRCGWETDELDASSFAMAGAYCDEQITTADMNGNQVSIPRFQCNLVVSKRRSAADLIRGIRNGSGLYLAYGLDGRLQLLIESDIAVQQGSKPASSNSTQTLHGGWPAYEFGDGTSGFSGIVRLPNGDPSVRLWSRSTADSPNRLSAEFQDQFNEYQQDSLSLVDIEDSGTTGQEVSASLTALGLPNFNQAARVIGLQLNRATRGNVFVDFETGLRAVGIRPGDLITITYLKEGFERQLFRVVRIAPGLNYSTSVITAQFHDDVWYSGGSNGLGLIGGGRQPSYDIGLPRPLLGTVLDADGNTEFHIIESSSGDAALNTSLSAGFTVPGKPAPSALGIPLLSLAPTIQTTGGTLLGGQTYYYAVSSLDGSGAEGPVSFTVKAVTPSSSDLNTVTLTGLSFGSDAAAYNVYRGITPLQLARIATAVVIGISYTDSGASPVLASAPDQNFHHANFYWRFELQPEVASTIFGTSSVGNAALRMLDNSFRGKVIRITSGTGHGQERSILSNDATTVNVAPPWDLVPDGTSRFTISEGSWQFGSIAQTSPAVFDVPNRNSATIQISGRAANANDKECAYELSPLTRYQLSTLGARDADVPPAPIFGLTTSGQGLLEVSGIGFTTLVNTSTITAASLTLQYIDELGLPGTPKLNGTIDVAGVNIDLTSAGSAVAGDSLQIDSELCTVQSVGNGGRQYVVTRGSFGSIPGSHASGAPVYVLNRRVHILSFPTGFFGSQASGSYRFPIQLTDIRVAAAEMTMTNQIGNGPPTQNSYTATTSSGLRTLSGGQLSLQVEGYLAIQTDAVPPLTLDSDRSARDIFATVGEAPSGADVQLLVKARGLPLCTLTIPQGQNTSNVVDGFGIKLDANSTLGLDIVSVGITADTAPGRDLTVTIRL